MKKQLSKFPITLWAIILTGLGLLSTYGQDGKVATSVLEFVKAKELIAYENTVPPVSLYNYTEESYSEQDSNKEKENILESREKEEDEIAGTIVQLPSLFTLPVFSWGTETLNYSSPKELFYQKLTTCIYLKDQVFLI